MSKPGHAHGNKNLNRLKKTIKQKKKKLSDNFNVFYIKFLDNCV